MQVYEICNEPAAADPPRTPPREQAGANENPSEINDNAKENEATENEDEEESASVGLGKHRRLCKQWTVLGEWDATQYLQVASEIEANILRVATEQMEESGLVEWPSTRAKPTRSIGLWCLCRAYVKDLGQTSVETYYCALSNCTNCPVQLSVTRALTTVFVETSGREHTHAR
jgi:hypothetical protein